MIRSFGKMEVLWVWVILLAGGLSLGTAMFYPLCYHLKDVNSAGYISYSGSALLFFIIGLIYTVKRSESFKSRWPNPQIFIRPLIFSSIIMTLPWSLTGYFFEYYRYEFLGGNWLAITVFSGLAVVHAVLLTFLVKE